MKKRIQIDSTILSLIIVFTGVLYHFPGLYLTNRGLDNAMDFLGLLLILKGTYLRMASRGFKKAYSQKGEGLVTSGLYRYMRNPMYLGSFLLGCGFVLFVWPWWTLPLFAGLFYLRFNKQMKVEEQHLQDLFGQDYADFCRTTPRLFPRISMLWQMDVKKCFPFQETWSTKERRGLWTWPLLALGLELLQEKFIFQMVDVRQIGIVFGLAVFVFAGGLAVRYRLPAT